MRLTLLVLAAALASAQCTILVQPFPLAATQRIFANGRESGLWKVVVRDHANADCIVTRQDVETLVPQVTFFASDVSIDLLTRKADLSKWSLFARYGGLVLQLAPVGMTLYGAISGTNGWTIGGAGTGALQFFVNRSTADAPNPKKYEAQFCEDIIMLPALGGKDCYLAAGLTHAAVPYGPFVIDQLKLAPAAPLAQPQAIPATPQTHALGVLPESWQLNRGDAPEETGLAAMRGGWGRQSVDLARR